MPNNDRATQLTASRHFYPSKIKSRGGESFSPSDRLDFNTNRVQIIESRTLTEKVPLFASWLKMMYVHWSKYTLYLRIGIEWRAHGNTHPQPQQDWHMVHYITSSS